MKDMGIVDPGIAAILWKKKVKDMGIDLGSVKKKSERGGVLCCRVYIMTMFEKVPVSATSLSKS